MKLAIHGLGLLFGAVLGIPAVAYLLDPRHRPARAGDFKTVARLNELTKDEPRQVVVRDLREDAWTLYPNDIIGRVWLIRRDGDQVDAFTTICPHLGCSVNYEEKAKLFICPCHNAAFDLNCHRVERAGTENPARRDMDRLECRKDPANPDLIQVKYLNFEPSLDRPVPKS